MTIRTLVLSPLLVGSFLGPVMTAQILRDRDVALKNWSAPLYWQPPAETASTSSRPEIRETAPKATAPAGSLLFVAMTPCRVVDTRASQMFPSPFGAPSLSFGPARSFPIQSSTLCTIPSNAMAYSFNVTVVPPGPLGYLTIWPTGQTQPNAVTLDDYPTGDIRNNGAIVPAGTPNGSVSVAVNGNTDLVIDINGYYAPLTGITLAQGTAAAPALSFSSDAGTGIFSSGMGSLSLTTGGTAALTVDSTGDVELAGSIRKGGALFLHGAGMDNLGVGLGALGSNTTGGGNTASGSTALVENTTGSDNTASGSYALQANTTGNFNTASGSWALSQNTTGSSNTAIGYNVLYSNTTGSYNTASGRDALFFNSTGSNNTASGFRALFNNTTGSNNTALGNGAGYGITTGSYNIDAGNAGSSSDGTFPNNGVIRIGDSTKQTSFFAAGIATQAMSGATVVINTSTGQLGISPPSSRRYKKDIQDMYDASGGLLKLRPVTFRYKKPYADGSQPLEYGLIAEEVAGIYPDLVVKNAEGQIENVQYHKLIPMLVNELQKEHETTQSLQAQLSQLRKEHEAVQKALEIFMGDDRQTLRKEAEQR